MSKIACDVCGGPLPPAQYIRWAFSRPPHPTTHYHEIRDDGSVDETHYATGIYCSVACADNDTLEERKLRASLVRRPIGHPQGRTADGRGHTAD